MHLVEAIRAGDVSALTALLAAHPDLATERIGSVSENRSSLHVATDWPGHFPDVAATVALLVSAGADVDARFAGAHRETPLHWAASSDDVPAIDALVAAGADLESYGGVHTDGTPLSDAVVFEQWAAARRLVEHGARMTLWQAAALGRIEQVTALVSGLPHGGLEITNACWHASRAGNADCVRLLVEHGADLDLPLHDGRTAREVRSSPGGAGAAPE